MSRPRSSVLPTRPAPRLLAAVALAASAASAAAQGLPAEAGSADAIRAFIAQQVPAGTGRVEVRLGQLDPRLQLAPCARVEPGLLPGTRLWGRSAIALRCREGASWTVTLPVEVVVRGRAVVAGENLAAGALPATASLRLEEAELSRDPGTPVTDPAQLVGKTLIRPLQAGHVIRMEHLRATQTVAPGDPVRIQLVGQGFTIQAEGQALAGAGEGQPIRVRTENGRILAGTLRGRTVEVRI